jgi:hypothetical protein
MFLRRTTLKSLAILLFTLMLSTSGVTRQGVPAKPQEETGRDIIADDFLKNRPSGKFKSAPKKLSAYRVATSAKLSNQAKVQVGVTIWRLDPPAAESLNAERASSGSYWNRGDGVPRRVEADAQFREGDTLRISIESPRDGYLYVVNRDWLADGSYGETNLIFPKLGEDNRLEAGKLIDIPARHQRPFKARPKPNQASELLTVIVTSTPLRLPLSEKVIAISHKQLSQWEKRWGGETTRLEMIGGAGQTRTKEEELAASPTRARQLTREDPMPQTIYSLVPQKRDGLLFNLVLSYVR